MPADASKIGPLTLPQLAEWLGVSRVTAWKRVRDGQIAAQKVGHNYIVSADTVSDLVRERENQIRAAVKKVVAEYGSVLELLSKE